MRTSTTCAAFVLAGITAALAQAPSASDADFVMKASAGNTFEIEEAKLAVDRAADPKLKQFAQQMIKDHGDAMKKLQDAAAKAGQKAAMTLDPPHQAMLDNLRGFNGAEFDRIYAADQVAAHAETVALLSDYNQNGRNSGLKSWAKQSLPVVKGHRAAIDAM